MKTKIYQRLYVGTSGWSYDHWKNNFYPLDLKSNKHLPYYSDHFKTVEINNTFYKLPSEKAISNWYDQVPEDFLFAIKASQYITHRKRLKEGEQTTIPFFERMALLKHKLGPILFQLPPNFKFDLERLQNFIGTLPRLKHYAFEFRNPSWFNDQTYEILQKSNCSLCLADFKGKPAVIELTADYIYIRLHGPQQAAYQGSYSEKALEEWATKIDKWTQHKWVYCYFDNDEKGYAIQDAQRLIKILK